MSASASPIGRIRPIRQAAGRGRILIVSNRLPVTGRIEQGEVHLQRSDGGLATSLRSVHEEQDGLWIGWSGLPEALSPSMQRSTVCRLRDLGAISLSLSEEEVSGYYRGYSNSTLWPVLHDCVRSPIMAAGNWELYRSVNQRYADLIAQHFRPGDRVWIHDYHLLLLPGLLRERCPGAEIGFFLHTPFPPAESFATLPQAAALLAGVLGADRIGFHTREYCRNFTATVRLVLGGCQASNDLEADLRQTRVFTCPMGIDVPFFAAWARKPAVISEAARIRSECQGPLFVGVDRLDYTKGIVERLLAFERLLDSEPRLRGRARLIQIAVPSRDGATGYAENRLAVERLVERISQKYGDGWNSVEYRYGRVDTATLVALYRAADVMLVTPICDGMNLVAKEFVACRDDEDGALVLSSRAGAAAELHAAVLTDPHDLDDLVRAYRNALDMSRAERRVRMRHLRQIIQDHDVFDWSRRCLGPTTVPDNEPTETGGGSAESIPLRRFKPISQGSYAATPQVDHTHAQSTHHSIHTEG